MDEERPSIIMIDLIRLLAICWIIFSVIFSPLIVLIHYSDWGKFWSDLKECIF